MPTPSHIQVRDARDRLIDLLKIGQTYPLRDLAVPDDQLTVPIESQAYVPIENSQPDVSYQLHDKEGKPVTREGTPADVPIEAAGNGETILLETNPIQEDVTFKVHATKLDSERAAYLHQTGIVKVGLDTKLKAWIREVPFLDPNIDVPAPTDARIIDYDKQVEVEVEKSQEGVDYTLVCVKDEKETLLSVTEVRGDRNNILLGSQPISDDTDIRIRATKTFDETENRATQTVLLEVVLPLKVRANPAVDVSVTTAIVDFQTTATVTVTIADSQPNVSYQLYVRRILDADFVRTELVDEDVLQVSVADKPDVQVRTPDRQETWQTREDYSPVGAAQPGTAGELQLETDVLADDSLIIVQAQKDHQVAQVVPSAIQLEQAVMVLVRPDPAPPLQLQILAEDVVPGGGLQVSDGQPGVLYYFRRTSTGEELGLPAYFHKRDDKDEEIDKGLGQMVLEIDFVVVRDGSVELPVLAIENLNSGDVFYVRAVKAQTGVETALAEQVQIPSDDE